MTRHASDCRAGRVRSRGRRAMASRPRTGRRRESARQSLRRLHRDHGRGGRSSSSPTCSLPGSESRRYPPSTSASSSVSSSSNLLTNALRRPCNSISTPECTQVCVTFITIFICYICISTLLQTKDDFRFIIPYVEFSKEVKGARPAGAGHLGRHRRPDRRRGRDPGDRPADGHSAVRASGAAEHRRQLRQAPPQPRAARARHPQPAAEVAGHRGADPRRARFPSSRASARSISGWSCWPSTWAARSSPTTTT